MLLGSHLAGHAGDVAVEPCPATVALAAVQVVGLPALASVFAGRGIAPTHQVLGGAEQEMGLRTQQGFCRRGGCSDPPQPACTDTSVSPRLYLAVEPGVSLGTSALVRPVAVLARAPVQARLGVTLVDVMLAVAAREAGQAHAGEGVDAVHTGPTIEAGAGNTHTTSQ